MSKQIEHIGCPEEWESTNDWDSHRPMLFLAINSVPHDCFFEYGMGEGSTPLLKKWYTLINPLGKEYYSFETNKQWASKYITDEYSNGVRPNSHIFKNHGIFILEEYNTTALPKSITFIDSAPGEGRKNLIDINKDSEVVIIHDTEPGAEYVYGMSEVLNSFKYRLDYQPKGKPHTTAVSNFINIEEWVK